jgi:hypothetical protein
MFAIHPNAERNRTKPVVGFDYAADILVMGDSYGKDEGECESRRLRH